MIRQLAAAILLLAAGQILPSPISAQQPRPQQKPVQGARVQHTADSIDLIDKNLSSRKAMLLDVREENETRGGYIDGALLVPLSMLQEGKQADGFANLLAQRIAKNKIVYCYCTSGGRALAAGEILKGFGYDVRPLKQGYGDLVRAGFVTAKPKPAKP